MLMIRLGLVVLLLSGCTSLVNNRLDDSDGGAGDAGPGDAGLGDAGLGDAGPMDSGPADGGGVPFCLGEVNGTVCGAGRICLGETCVESICGDMFVDEAGGEDCEDGDADDGDGCDSDCTFSCTTASECMDDLTCNGEETCNTEHRCEPGTPESDGTACTPEPATCQDGLCVPASCGNGEVDHGEDCEDGNSIAGDGCEPDCTFTCVTDTDCDDDVYCTGVETCTDTHLCESSGTPTTPEDCATPFDDNCNGDSTEAYPTCYPDADGDETYSDTNIVFVGCDCPDGSTPTEPSAEEVDCDDSDPRVSPRQVFQGLPARNCGGDLGCLPFDFNCDGVVEQLYPVMVRCDGGFATCRIGNEGWVAMRIPSCGDDAPFAMTCERLANMCAPNSVGSRPQLCQ